MPTAPYGPALAWVAFLLFLRSSALVVTAPVLSHHSVPPLVKVGLAAGLALVLAPLVPPETSPPATLAAVIEAVLREALFGLAFGLAMNLAFAAIQMASRAVGVQIGFSIGGVVDPISGVDSGALDQFYVVLATLVFFAVEGHHAVLLALGTTVRAIPPGTFDPFAFSAEGIAAFGAGLFVIAVRVALPLLVALLLVDFGLGFVARTVPQVQVLLLGLPLKVGVGLLVMIAALPATAYLMKAAVEGPMAEASAQLMGVR